MSETEKDSLTLKWGTLKGWKLNTPKCRELLQEYAKLGISSGAMTQQDTPEQKDLICSIIDHLNADTVYLDWDDKDVSKEEAKDYVRNYGKKAATT